MDKPMHLSLHIDPNQPGTAILAELLASVESKEMLVEQLEDHFSAALRDAVFDLLPYREGIDDCQFEVTVDSDTVSALLLACQAALHAVEHGQGNEIGPLLVAAIARATEGRGFTS